MGFKVKVFLNSTFATTAENRALRELIAKLSSVNLPPSDPYSGENAPLWLLVEPRLSIAGKSSPERISRPDLVIFKRNACMVIELKHWWGELVLPRTHTRRDDVWDSRAPGGLCFDPRKPNPLVQVEYNCETLVDWLNQYAHEFAKPPVANSNWHQLGRAILFTHPELKIHGGIPEYVHPTIISSLHGVESTTDIVTEIASLASGVRNHKLDPTPRIFVDDAFVMSLAQRLQLSEWDPMATRFPGPEGIIASDMKISRDRELSMAVPDLELADKPVPIRVIRFHRLKLIEEAKSNPDINLRQLNKASASFTVLDGGTETIISQGSSAILPRDRTPKALLAAPEIAYGLFWNVRTDPDTDLWSASPLFYVSCALSTQSESHVKVTPIEPSKVELNIELLKTFRPFSLYDEDQITDCLRSYEQYNGYDRIPFILGLIDEAYAISATPGMRLDTSFPENADLVHAGVVFIPDRMMTKRLIADLSSIESQWMRQYSEGSTPSDLAWQLLSARDTGAISSSLDYRSRISTALNYEQSRVLAISRDPAVNLLCVQGPPGTGKTRVLSCLAADAVATKSQFVVASTNNTAVSAVVDQLNASVRYPALFKVGSTKSMMDFNTTLSDFVSGISPDISASLTDADREESLAILNRLDQRIQALGQSLDEYYQLRDELRRAEARVNDLLMAHPDLASIDVSDTDRALILANTCRAIASEYYELLSSSSSFFKRLVQSFKGRIGALKVFSKSSFMTGIRIWRDLTIRDSLPKEWWPLLHDRLFSEYGDSVRRDIDDLILSSEIRALLATAIGMIDAPQLRAELAEVQADRASVCKDLLRHGRLNRRIRDARAYPTAFLSDSPDLLAATPHFMPVGCTLHSLAKYFSVMPSTIGLVAIDEASQCSIGVALPALFRARKVIVVGDTRQLQPVATLDPKIVARLSIECSVNTDDLSPFVSTNGSLQLVVERHLKTIGSEAIVSLVDHHRSVPEIISFSNRTFYHGELRILRTSDGTCNPLQWIAVQGEEIDKANQIEAAAVMNVIRELLQSGVQPSGIGVVTPFSHQKLTLTHHFLNAFDESILGSKESPGVLIDTAHGFQGNERHTMIFSTVITSNSRPSRRFWVTASPTAASLINVSVTRATDRLIVVGDPSAADGYLGDLRDWIKGHTNSSV